MTRHMLNDMSYTNDPSLEYRHPASRLPPGPQISHDRSYSLTRSNPRADPMARQPPRLGPASHAANSAAGTPRRRIPVACGRCRKRKIRCSGDPGDSTGCNNCKGAQVGPGLCVFLRVQCEMRELVPDHVLMMGGYEQVSSAAVNLNPYSSSSTSSSAPPLALAGLPHPMHSVTASQNFINTQSLRIGGHHHNNMHNNHSMSLKSLYHQDPMTGGGSGDSNAGLLLAGSIGVAGHRTQYDGLGGDMTGGTIHGSSSNGMPVSTGDMYNGNYPQYMHPDIGQGVANSVLHGQHWAPLGGRQNPGLYLDQDQSTMQNYMSTPNQPLGTYPMVFPALTSLSSSLPDGISPRTPVNEKVQLPLPIRTQASETTNTANLRPSSAGNSLVSDTVSSGYGSQPLQTSYRAYTSWGGDTSFSSASQSSGMAIPANTSAIPSSQQTPALPVPCSVNTYGAHNPTFPLSSSNSSLLPASHPTSNISSSPTDTFPPQTLPLSHQKNRSNSESSNGSKAITPAPAMRINSTSSSTYSPSYSRPSVDINAHGTQPLQRRTLSFNKVY